MTNKPSPPDGLLAVPDSELQRLRSEMNDLRKEIGILKPLRWFSRTSEAARAANDGASDLEAHVYRSGATIIIEVFDRRAGAWRSVTLT